jgi:hypothetical protein
MPEFLDYGNVDGPLPLFRSIVTGPLVMKRSLTHPAVRRSIIDVLSLSAKSPVQK